MSLPDYYAVLGVSSTASATDIGRAYRSRALQLHPDKQDDERSSFQQLVHAYTVLSDTHQRQQYDQQRQAAELTASSAARAQLWTDVLWSELEYSSAKQQNGVEEDNEESEVEEQLGQYSYVCKCGYRYSVSEEQLDRLLDDLEQDVKEICLSCESCSLAVRITADER